jgi:tetratricopeptide (TPR) repeat protein
MDDLRDAHLTAESLELLFEEEHTEEENRLLLHHLAVCEDCYKVGGYILDLYRAGAIDLEFSSIDLGLGRSRLEAPKLWEELREQPFAEQRRIVRRSSRYSSWGLCELLCNESIREGARSATVAEHRAELAVLISSRIDPEEPAEPGWLALLQGYAWCHLANARKVRVDLRKAEKAMIEADARWEPAAKDLGNVLGYEARYLALKASLRREERKLAEAEELLDQALSATEDQNVIAKLVLGKAKVLEEKNEHEAAVEVLKGAADTIQVENDPRLALCLEHNLVWLLASTGKALEARLRFPALANLSRSGGDVLDLLRLGWVEARIALGLGELEEAAGILDRVRHGFEKENMGFDAALVTLELAIICVRQGHHSDVSALAADALPLFQSNGIEREALAALALFKEAADANRLTVELAEQVLSRVEKSSRTATRTKLDTLI